jgi:eukaryotic-like serine/threonine-protein kinase
LAPVAETPNPLLTPRYGPTFEQVGRGGFGTVFRTWDAELEIPVAVKVPHRGPLLEEVAREMTAELQASARLRHPGVAQVLDAGRSPDGWPFLVMEYAGAGSIGDWIFGGPPAWSELRRVLLELLEAIGHAHARGLLHRDIKPDNVLLARGAGDRLEPRLTDFGLAKVRERRDDYRSTRLMAGTLLYMAPESFEASTGSLHPAADLYAFGVLMYSLLSTRSPWDATGLGLVWKKAEAPARPLEIRAGYEAPPGVEELVASLLRRDPAERPQLAADVRALLLALDDEDAPDHAPGPFRPRLRWPSRSATSRRLRRWRCSGAPGSWVGRRSDEPCGRRSRRWSAALPGSA